MVWFIKLPFIKVIFGESCGVKWQFTFPEYKYSKISEEKKTCKIQMLQIKATRELKIKRGEGDRSLNILTQLYNFI